MNFGSLMKVILAFGVTVIVLTSGNKATKGASDVNTGTIAYDNLDLDLSKSVDSEFIEYTNTNSHPVNLTNRDIFIVCTGSGSTKDEDEALCRQNMKLSVLFFETKNGIGEESIVVDKNETIYIKVSSSYEGTYPKSEVQVQYGINISVS